MQQTQRITPCLWFDHQAEEAVALYTRIFPNSMVTRTTRYGEEGREIHGKPAGSVMTVEFELDGHSFTALNGGPTFKFTEAISFQVNCDSQAEVDHYWENLRAGGDETAQQCGWLKDAFGVSWQIVPAVLIEMLTDPDAVKSARVTATMMQMKKLDVAQLRRAYDG